MLKYSPLLLKCLAARAAAPSSVVASTEYISKRIRRHLNDLERTNYTEPSGGGGNYGLGFGSKGKGDEDGDFEGGTTSNEAIKDEGNASLSLLYSQLDGTDQRVCGDRLGKE